MPNHQSDPSIRGDQQHHDAIANITHISVNAPFKWLTQAWDDFRSTRFRGMFYGAVFVLMGYMITWQYATKWQLTMGLISGFFLMGPFVCTGLYALSRQLERGEEISLRRSMISWKLNPGSIGFFAIILTFLMIVWARVSVIIFALSSTTTFPNLQGVLSNIFTLQNPLFLLLWVCVGFIFSIIVFAIGVVSVPMMLDRNSDALTAIFCSTKALRINPLPLFVWGILVVAIIGSSLMLGFLPLLVTAPLIGHATWQAYRDLVEPEN